MSKDFGPHRDQLVTSRFLAQLRYYITCHIHTLANRLRFQQEIFTVLKIVTESGPHNLLRELFVCLLTTSGYNNTVR